MDNVNKKETAATVAADVVVHAAEAARDIARSQDERTTQSLVDALREVFGENQNTGRFIDVSRIPLICQNITGIHGEIAEIKGLFKEFSHSYVRRETFQPVEKVVYGVVGIILVGVVGALLALVIK